MARWQPSKWCTSRHPDRGDVVCQMKNDHIDFHRAEVGPPLKVTLDDGTIEEQAQVVSWP